jgi:hypothetical protein
MAQEQNLIVMLQVTNNEVMSYEAGINFIR